MAHLKTTRVASPELVEQLQAELKKYKSVVKAADDLANAAHATFGPTKDKTGNEDDELDSALSAYYQTRQKALGSVR